MSATVTIEPLSGYRVVTLDRPSKLNALDEEMQSALLAAIDGAAADQDCRALLLTGTGRGFCVGQDLAAVPLPDDELPDLSIGIREFYNPLIRRITNLRFPVVCAVNGIAAGAGANIALTCDIVLAARSARFIEAFANIGLVPDAGGTWTLPRLVGIARARAMCLLAEPIEAERAEKWGLIWRCVDDGDLLSEAHATCAKLARGSAVSHELTRRALFASATNTLDEQLELEGDLQQQAGWSRDPREGISAFLEKREARFRTP